MAKKSKVNSPRKMIATLYDVFNKMLDESNTVVDDRPTANDMITLAQSIVDLERQTGCDLARQD